ncbi:MAG: Polyketide cyclase / dehydrase family protein [Jatrophihabitantaceae bacterium]|nr:Polyketide cyclase / dehydrase family protein [Jatrophihabitantaceae bacterium]
MADTSTQSIRVEASPAAVMSVIADFAAYPSWAASVKRCQVVAAGPDGRAERVRFLVENGPVKDDYELAYVWTGDDAVEWSLVRGQMQKAQKGSYRLRGDAGGTEVVYSLAIEPAIPMLGLLKRKVQKVILDTALKELKKHVEARGA